MSAETLLDPKHLIDKARQETGLQEFDDLPLWEPLEVMTKALIEEGNLNAVGVQTWHYRLLNFLMGRLRAQYWFTKHPEILQEEIKAPVVILGLARTGTTLLHRLIASDSRFYSAAWWENRFPVPAVDDISGEKRISMAKAEVAAILEASPELAAIHPWDALGADEDILLIDQSLMSTTHETMGHMPSYHEWIKKQDLRPAYGYWKKLLQLLQWQKKQRGVPAAERWVLKTPMHMGYCDVIAELFPDVRFIQTHRDPLQTIPSFASMIYSLWLGVSDSAPAAEAGRETVATLGRYLDHCMKVRQQLPAGTFFDVDFRETVSNPVGLVERIMVEHLGMEFTPLARQQVEGYMANNPREKRPPHNYTLEQFGLTEAGVKERFKAYRDRHVDGAK